MQYKLGLDFGTTTSILSYLDKDGKPSTFSYGGKTDDGTPYVPTVVLYDEDDLQIGQYAVAMESDGLAVERYFKLRLSQTEKVGDEKSAEHLTADFIGELIKGTCPSREKVGTSRNKLAFTEDNHAAVDNLVIAVPYSWENDDSTARNRLRRAVIDELNLPLSVLVSEPVAAAAYFSYCYRERKNEFFKGNLLVCDMGGGTFDVTLCRVGIDSITPIVKDGSANADGFGIAGNYFDRTLIENCFGQFEANDLSELMTVLDREKKSRRNTQKLIKFLDSASTRSTSIYRLLNNDQIISIEDLIEAFSGVRQSINEVLQKVIEKAHAENESIDRVVLVGGFGKFPLVQRAVRDFLVENGYRSDELLDYETLTTDEMAYAISYGACLIAGGLVETSEKYRIGIGVCVTDAAGEERQLPLIKPGTSLSKLKECVLSVDAEGRQIPFRIGTRNFQVEFAVETDDGSSFLKMVNFTIPDRLNPENRRFFIGGRVDSYFVPHLVLQDEKSGENFEFSLEKLFTNSYDK